MGSLFKRTIFWQKVERTFAILGSIETIFFGSGVIEMSKTAVIIIGSFTLLGLLVGMWMEDRDADGTPDIFQ